MEKKKALIAMSGGVDSSVAAYLTMQEGFQCGGAIMRLYIGQTRCQSGDAAESPDVQDARNVAETLGMPFYIFDCADFFRQKVIESFCDYYEMGLTPNPCILCNHYLKFGLFLQKALELGYDYIVTGHYAQVDFDTASGRYLLKKAADPAKDQSYFLYRLSQNQLSHVHFPLGTLTKAEAREIAQAQGLINARKRDSQDICFVPDGDYRGFLTRYTGHDYPAGDFLDEHGKVIGKHTGAVGYTIGQRKGLGLAMGESVYVCGKNMEENTVTVGSNESLFRRELVADDWFWFPFPTLTSPIHVTAKARSRMADQPAWVYPGENGTARVVFDEPQRALTPGQAVVLYDGDMVIGGGTIRSIL